jgi:flagellar hook-associated protein FlgK
MLNGTSFAIEGFTRQYSSVIGSQLLSQQAKASYSDTLVQHTAILDSIIGDKSASLSGALNEFFNAMGTYAADPSSHALAANITNKANIAEDLKQRDKDLEKHTQVWKVIKRDFLSLAKFMIAKNA